MISETHSGSKPKIKNHHQMSFKIRKWIRPEDLNPIGTLFGGSLLRWIDEEAAIFASLQLDSLNVVTKFISEINFLGTAHSGDIIEMEINTFQIGETSITLSCEVRNKINNKPILTIQKLVFVNVNKNGLPFPHGKPPINNIIL